MSVRWPVSPNDLSPPTTEPTQAIQFRLGFDHWRSSRLDNRRPDDRDHSERLGQADAVGNASGDRQRFDGDWWSSWSAKPLNEEMTSPPSPPNRRRRRVVVVSAVLVIGLSWWFWPRVDQRLVGTWELNNDSSGLVGFKLFADGTVEIAGALSSDGELLPVPWKVEGDVLFLSQQQTEYDGLQQLIELQLRSAWDRMIQPAEAFGRWRIVEVTDNSLTLESLWESDHGRVSKYHRLPDGAEIDVHSLRWLSP